MIARESLGPMFDNYILGYGVEGAKAQLKIGPNAPLVVLEEWFKAVERFEAREAQLAATPANQSVLVFLSAPAAPAPVGASPKMK